MAGRADRLNVEQLKAFVWLRWRLAANSLRRSGPGGTAVAAIFTALMVGGGVITFVTGLALGVFALATAAPRVVMAAWDIVIAGYVVFWLVGLVAELQRSDDLALDRFLHLPVAPSGAFLINYVGSSLSLSLVLFLPLMTGLALGLTISRGPEMLPLFPLVAAFFLMLTALIYQFRGWLASLMANPRRRRMILAAVPALFLIAFQLPQLWQNLGPGATERREARAERRRTTAQLREDLDTGRITQEEFERRRPRPAATDADASYATARTVNMVLPPGWLAYGAEAAAEGRLWSSLMPVLGMGILGALSLRRSYTTTLRLYRGDFDRSPPAPVVATLSTSVRPAERTGTLARPTLAFLERDLPGVSSRAAAVTLAGFRSAMRAPEIKMALLMSPAFMLIILAGFFGRGDDGAPELLRPLQAGGMAAFLMTLALLGPAGNQFGFDRGGFRAFVLAPVPRQDVLLGKNLALLPFALGLMTFVILLSHAVQPMRLDHLGGALVGTIPTYLLFCLGGNTLSIVGPMTLKPGSGMPARHQGLRQFYPLGFMLVLPLLVGVAFIPLGVEALLVWLGYTRVPAYLVLGLLEAGVAIAAYRAVLTWQGRLLQRREQQVLEIVAARVE